jgi:hypothetical protein
MYCGSILLDMIDNDIKYSEFDDEAAGTTQQSSNMFADFNDDESSLWDIV